MLEQETCTESTPKRWSFLEAVEDLAQKHPVQPKPFKSDVPIAGPLIAGFREKWNSIAAKWYVLPIVQQVNEFNGVLLDLLQVNFQALEERLTAIAQHLADIDLRLANIEIQLQDADVRMIATDRDQVELGRTLAELHYQLIQTQRVLAAIPGTPKNRDAGSDVSENPTDNSKTLEPHQ